MPRPVLGESCTTSIKDFAIFPPHKKKKKKKKSTVTFCLKNQFWFWENPFCILLEILLINYHLILAAHFEWWMRSKVHLSEDQISDHLKNAKDYIGKKIAEWNRGPREYRRKKDSKGKKKSANKFKSVEKIEENDYKSDKDSRISPPGPSVDLMDPEENEEHIGTPSESLQEK